MTPEEAKKKIAFRFCGDEVINILNKIAATAKYDTFMDIAKRLDAVLAVWKEQHDGCSCPVPLEHMIVTLRRLAKEATK